MKSHLLILLTVLTTYSSGVFHTNCEVSVNASANRADQVIDLLIRDLQTNPQHLSEWAFLNVGEDEDADKNAFYLVWKDAEYDPSRNYSKIIMDILVHGKPMFRDAYFESYVTDSVRSNGQRDVHVDVNYSGSILKSAYGNFHIRPLTPTTSLLSIDTHVRFGWFFNIFITRKVYRDVVDWRVEQFMNNLKEYAEQGKISKTHN